MLIQQSSLPTVCRMLMLCVYAVLLSVALISLLPQENSDLKGYSEHDIDIQTYAVSRTLAHEQIGSWEPMVLSLDLHPENRVLVIKVADPLLTGTDHACLLFGRMMKHLTRNGWVVLIENEGWIPSPERLIDQKLAERLATGGLEMVK